ncbi:hypothetical protein QBC34DRAFT_2042 [Podospora aff. communis PSN243]|uniref:Secreted protein n=1 Tax=Podospora aff. communis PSN243 TaxID=3040156 RepID=A0AAV9H5W7_9PEZI|nr:hypothetical protein QBC34DRAFT_2042 [Podospora aff. communis PSN243]
MMGVFAFWFCSLFFPSTTVKKKTREYENTTFSWSVSIFFLPLGPITCPRLLPRHKKRRKTKSKNCHPIRGQRARQINQKRRGSKQQTPPSQADPPAPPVPPTPRPISVPEIDKRM